VGARVGSGDTYKVSTRQELEAMRDVELAGCEELSEGEVLTYCVLRFSLALRRRCSLRITWRITTWSPVTR